MGKPGERDGLGLGDQARVGARPVLWGPLANSHPWSPPGGHASTERVLWVCSRTGAQGWVLWVGVPGCLCCDLNIKSVCEEQPVSFFRDCLRLYKEISKLYGLKYLWDV